MGIWVFSVISLFLGMALAVLVRRPSGHPPGPLALPIVGNLLWLYHSTAELDYVIGDLWFRYGPVVTIHLGLFPMVMVADRDIAHMMLVQKGSFFADRASSIGAIRFLSLNMPTISTLSYGHRWRLFRRNIATELFNPAPVRQCSDVRDFVLNILREKLRAVASSGDGVVVVREVLRCAMFQLVVCLCFGEKLEASVVREMDALQRETSHLLGKLNIFVPSFKMVSFLFNGGLRRFLQLRQRQRGLFLPLIQSRRQRRESGVQEKNSFRLAYLDSLLNLEIPEEGGKQLNDEEIFCLCDEFLNAGADTTPAAIEWIMANLVKNPGMQEKLAEEVGSSITEEDLAKTPYLKAVILEGLRRHAPSRYLLPHAVKKEISIGGYTISKGCGINVSIPEINLDGEVWQEPLEFRPERFLPGGEGEDVDLTGSKKIKMLPFGAGRRICPAMGFALFHVEYFVANLVGEFRWEPVDGNVDLSERLEFASVMKNPLRARVSFRHAST